ncbi:Hypothetical predicted protein [Mytilus galloprovincialis]|uniref:DED domain-containing protein n=1 Tax=Mytilus galloprovincialis TaxID=29158 RepID=A0A8B6F076_MYTGA|nr:Hypothetical predicted protein [Mytilus galloprovincialis]
MESVVFDSYRILTKEVALGLSPENIKVIKFLIRDVGKGVLEKITRGTDLVQLLEERCMLSAENVEKLSTLLQVAGRNDLDKNVQQYVESAISRNLSNHVLPSWSLTKCPEGTPPSVLRSSTMIMLDLICICRWAISQI